MEEIKTIVNRVVRAKCCLRPQNPEEHLTLTNAVGDGSEYYEKPFQKAFRIRLKFLNNKFL